MSNQRVAFVTGGSGGIGKAFVERLSSSGYKVWTVARKSEHYNKCLNSWGGNNNIIPFTGDITEDKCLEEIVDDMEEKAGCMDLLINNAGIYIMEDGGFPDPSVLRKNLEVNTVAPYRVILRSLPLLEKGEKPVILNITSGAGSFAGVNSGGPLAYRMSKAAANMLTKSLSYELKEKNIALHAADPGWVKTRLNPGGTDSPENAVEGMWHLTTLHDMEETGKFWFWGKVMDW